MTIISRYKRNQNNEVAPKCIIYSATRPYSYTYSNLIPYYTSVNIVGDSVHKLLCQDDFVSFYVMFLPPLYTYNKIFVIRSCQQAALFDRLPRPKLSSFLCFGESNLSCMIGMKEFGVRDELTRRQVPFMRESSWDVTLLL